MTSGVNERPYLSIGEVLALLLEEFPDVTISKIRFLESQGLIEPERTSSGYRKFFDADIERLRVILREQRENYLPLRVIRDRLETGEIDDSGAIPNIVAASPVSQLHRGIRNVRVDTGGELFDPDGDHTAGTLLDDPTGTISPEAHRVVTSNHPAAQPRPLAAVVDPAPEPPAGDVDATSETAALLAAGPPARVHVRAELCSLAGLTASQLTELESFGLITGRGSGTNTTFSDGDLAIARAAGRFLERGIDARHLRGWRQAAEREASLFEQRILPLLRQRNPQARHDALELLVELADLGAELRQALVISQLRHHLDS